MWKKDETTRSAGESTTGVSAPPPPDRPTRKPVSSDGTEATIGRSITIRGDVTGDEDLVIQGRVDGKVDLEKHSVTVGPEGRVKADIAGRTVTIEGEVDGNVRGQEQVVLRASSKVTGDIIAPRVVLEDGASFLGSIDMSGKAPAASKPTPVRDAGSKPEPPSTPASSSRPSTAEA